MGRMHRKITIVVRGHHEGDIELALNRALKRVHEGYLVGHDRNDTGAYRFEVTENVPAGELPA